MKFLITYLTIVCVAMHPLKMSNSKITITDNSAKVELRMFLDDLTHHIQQKYRIKKVDFSTTESNGTLALQRYLNECFYLIQNNKKILFKIENVSLSIEDIALEVYLKSSKTINSFEDIQIRNAIMLDVFKKQENIVRFYTQDNEFKMFSCTIDDPIQSFL